MPFPSSFQSRKGSHFSADEGGGRFDLDHNDRIDEKELRLGLPHLSERDAACPISTG